VDWDWEDGSPRDQPRDEPAEEPRRPDDSRPSPAADSPSFADAIDRFEAPAQPAAADLPRYHDEEHTQVIQAPQRVADDVGHDGRSARDDRRQRPPADRAAARARRRRQIRRRRLVALGVVIVVAILLAVLVVRGCGGPTEGQAAAIDPSPTPAVLRTPAAAEPLRMAADGESVGATDRHVCLLAFEDGR
jgi:cell division septation protein DedD